MFNALQQRLLNDFQQDFPLSPTPYRDIARTLGVEEDEVLAALTELTERNCIARIGPVIAPNHLGVSTLAAMAVPPEKLRQTAELVSACPEVNHNYEREHTLNLWFVIIASDDTHLQQILIDLERRSGFAVMSLPLLEDYFINLGFALDFDENLS
ncbi:MAG: Lrp/AsnC family transcriptional regulator [Gammaproteobacteria bacterium]